MKRIGYLSIACAMALTIACSGTEQRDAERTIENAAPGTIGTAGEGVDGSDRDFVDKAAHAGMAEIELGRLASERGLNADVKKFAAMMIEDHSKSGEALKQIAGRYNIAVPQGLSEDHQELREKLSTLQGAEFDREYMTAMVGGHEDVVDLLETRVDGTGITGADKDTNPRPEQSDNAATMSLNEWSANTLPTTRRHLDSARQIDERLQDRRNTTN